MRLVGSSLSGLFVPRAQADTLRRMSDADSTTTQKSAAEEPLNASTGELLTAAVEALGGARRAGQEAMAEADRKSVV